MSNVIDLAERREARQARLDSLVSCCMNCGAEYPYVMRYGHNCQDETGSKTRHPSNM